MPYIKHKLVLRIVALCILTVWMPGVSAEESAKPATAAAVPTSKEQREFYEKSSKLTTLTNRIVESDKRFTELVAKKNHAKTAEAKQLLIKEMVELNGQRNKDVENYNKLKSDLALRYPNQGEHLNRQYKTQSKRSIEDLEEVAGLDELLSRTKKVIEKKFAPFMENEPKSSGTTKSPLQTKSPVATSQKPERLRLEK